MPFHLTEACFDRVVLWRVGNIEDWHDVQRSIEGPYISFFVHTELVHEDCKRNVTVFFPEPLEIIDELFSIYGGSIYFEKFHTSFS